MHLKKWIHINLGCSCTTPRKCTKTFIFLGAAGHSKEGRTEALSHTGIGPLSSSSWAGQGVQGQTFHQHSSHCPRVSEKLLRILPGGAQPRSPWRWILTLPPGSNQRRRAMVRCVCVCKSYRGAIWGSPSPDSAHRCSLHSGCRSRVLELLLFLFWGSVLLCFPRWPVSLCLFHPWVFLALLGSVSLIIKVAFPSGPVPMGSREPGTLGRAAQQAAQPRYFNCRAPPGLS